MKILLICFFTSVFTVPDASLLSLRRFLYEAERNEQVAAAFYSQTRSLNENKLPIERGYKAMAAFMMCKYEVKPWSKLSYFNEGKKEMENAIAQEPKNVELVFLRFTTQTNIPAFLRYNASIVADKRQLLHFLEVQNRTSDSDLHSKIVNFLLQSKYCTAEEKSKIKKQ